MDIRKTAKQPPGLHEQLIYEKLAPGRRKQILTAVAIGTFMSALDSSVVNIALPRISAYFHSPLAVIEWVIMAYLLIISSLLLTYGRLGDMYGHKQIYITGFVIFTIGSVFCGMAPTILFLIIFRAVQAIGAGMLMSMGPAIITNITPPAERGRALGVNAVAVSVALATGPVVGGLLTAHLGWESIFYINIPVGIIGVLWANKVIPQSTHRETQNFDITGAVLVFLALTCILAPLSYSEKAGWGNPLIIAALAAGFVLLGLFVFVEKRIEHPMMDLKLFHNRLFTMSNVSALLNYLAQYSVVLLMPFYLQQLRGLSPSQAGLMLIPMPLTTMIIAPISGALSDRVDTRYISSAGMAIAALGIWQLSNLHADSPVLAVILALATVGLGTGTFQTPNNSAIMGSVSDNRRGIASGMLATMRNVGMVLGVAISGAIFTSRQSYMTAQLTAAGATGEVLRIQAFTSAFHFTYTIAALIACAAILTSLSRGRTKPKKVK